jgi:hypothetical protein
MKQNPILKVTNVKGTGRRAQVVEILPRTLKVLSSTPSSATTTTTKDEQTWHCKCKGGG